MVIVRSRDVQDIVEKLSSDKAKARDEGIKLLNTWLEGERSFNFCKFLGQGTAKLRPDEIPHSETWPFLISVLIQSTSLEISSSKRRMPKMVYAKTLRVVVQRAEDAKYSGKMLPLSHVVKPLFSHVWDVLSNVPSFQSEYGIILRHLLAVKDYGLQMRKRIYQNLVFLYIENVETSLNGNNTHHVSKEEVFRDEGKISRKLVECINSYLLNDGPNLGCRLLEIHNALQQFVFRFWLTTHDRILKDALMFYARLQLNLLRSADDGCSLVEQLLDVVCKDLDQGSMSSSSMPWGDGTKDDRFGALSSSHCGLVELAAVLFYRACLNTTQVILTEKRVKKEPAAVLLRDALIHGKWLWGAAFCCLTRNYHSRISKDLFLYWFEGIWMSFDRILNSANLEHAYDGLLWTLRSLQELSLVLLHPNITLEISSMSSSTLNEFINGWQLIWNTTVHGLPIYSNITAIVDAALVLLGNITSNDVINACVIPQDVWDLQLFKRPPSMPTLYFFICYFSRKNSHVDLRDILHLRKNLLRAALSHLNWKGSLTSKERMVLLLPPAVYALCTGQAPFTQCFKEFPLSSCSLDIPEALDDCHKIENPKHQSLHDFLDCSVEALTKIDSGSKAEVFKLLSNPVVHLPREISDQLLLEMETSILGSLVVEEIKERQLPDIFFQCSLLSNLLYGSFSTRKANVVFLSKLSQYVLLLLDHAVNIIQQDNDFRSLSCLSNDSACDETRSVVASIRSFLFSPLFNEWRYQNAMEFVSFGEVIQYVERLLKALVKLYQDYSQRIINVQSEVIVQDVAATDGIQSSLLCDSSKIRIMDVELDVNDDSVDVDILTAGKNITSGITFSAEKWKMGMVSLIACFFCVSQVITWDMLFNLLEDESDPKVRGKILHHLCQHPHWSSCTKFVQLVNLMNDMIEEHVRMKADCGNVLGAARSLLSTLSSLDAAGKENYGLYLRGDETKQCFQLLGNLVQKVAELDLDWFGRMALVDCICDLVLLSPKSARL
ncbi:serine/threonine-protein kinase ATM-like isoform X2 [Prosopis cineraria]|uniref:serine/threonine-protein kinase ATM-like isoform X2 n=1 Tax=Prosopis cineraria TaxID=364024 RepID=UPI00241023A0|nr:serine/threonine-protein kinase ATM-like isoform X2 [Prosopis cineraria]